MRLALVDLAPRHLEITRAWRNHPASRAWFGDPREITPEAQRAWFAARVDDRSDRIYILEDDGRPVAQFSVYRIEGDAAEVGRFLVDPAARRRGYFSKGFALLVERMRSMGIVHTHLVVKKANAGAIAAYVRCGFRKVGDAGDDARMELDLR